MFTLSDCIIRINQILNYPSVAYTDISHFFDQAISELNTTFKIGLPLISTMVSENKFELSEIPNLVLLDKAPYIIPAVPDDTGFTDTVEVYFNLKDNLFYKYARLSDSWVGYDKVYGLYIENDGTRKLYQTFPAYTTGSALWTLVNENRLNDFELNTYLPDDWVILFLIPYVCFKTAVRDGMDGNLYRDEYVQGFQQLQTSYDVPHFVDLYKVAHLPAYKPEVKKHIAALNVKVPTRAVYDTMKVGNTILAEYGGFNSRGGWGI